MPRYPRKYSKIGVYHLIPRDNGREDIFIDEEDKRVIKEFINYNKKLSEEPSL